MKILIYSPAFFPSVGGLETLVSILAAEFVANGHEVRVVSQTANNQAEHFSFEVIRRPGVLKLLDLTRWCDVYFQANISLRGLWPLMVFNKPLVASHNNWYQRSDGRRGWQDHLKHYFSRRATGISVSNAVAKHVGSDSTVIPHAYRAEVFRFMPEVRRNRDLVFVGRLVSDKGADVLLDALGLLKTRGLTPRLTIVGDGPEMSRLRAQAVDLGLDSRVEFAGVKRDEELAAVLNAHRIMVVPSRWREPFGIVALEGIACGCVVVGSEGGGLKDAIGPCGVTFPNGNVEELAAAIARLLTDDEKLESFRAHAETHLAAHQPAAVAKAYLQVFDQVVKRRNIGTQVVREEANSTSLSAKGAECSSLGQRPR
jgi:glycogen(starch) synthase